MTASPSRIRSTQVTSPSGAAGSACSRSASNRISVASGNAVTPLITSPPTKTASHTLIHPTVLMTGP